MMLQAPSRIQCLPRLIQPYEIKYAQGKIMPVADILRMSTVAETIVQTRTLQSMMRSLGRQHCWNKSMLTNANLVGRPDSHDRCSNEVPGYWNYIDERSVHNGLIPKALQTNGSPRYNSDRT